MNNPDLVERTNRAHKVFLDKLTSQDAADSDFLDWLSGAALNLCVILKNTALKEKLKHVKKLAAAVKEGFKRDDLLNGLHDLSIEERDRLMYSKSLFAKMFTDKTDESKTFEEPISLVLEEPEEKIGQESITSKKAQMMAIGEDKEICTICENSFKSLKCLPCFHVFCMPCLKETGRRTNKNPGDLMPCGSCGLTFKIPKEGYDSLLNFPTSTGYTCGDCAEESELGDAPPAVIYCFDCDRYLCAECRRYHKKSSYLKKHDVRELEDPPKVSAAFGQLTIKEESDENKASEVEVHSSQALSSKGSLAAAESGQPIIERKADHEMMERVHPERDRLLELNAKYLSSLPFSKSENIQEQFNNCLIVRTLLFISRERLFTFISHSFGEFIQAQGLSNNNKSYTKKMIKDKVRSSLANADQRKSRIEALDESHFTADWRTFAMCYTGSFLKRRPTQMMQFEIQYAEPRDLLQILMNCSLFSDELCGAAHVVIALFNQYYAHLSVLLIDSDILAAITQSVHALARLIQ